QEQDDADEDAARDPHALRELPRPCGAGTGGATVARGATLTDGTTTGDGTGYGGAGDGGPAAAVGERSGMIRHRRIVTAGTDACRLEGVLAGRRSRRARVRES